MSNRSINAQVIRPYKVEIFGLQDDYIGTLQSFEDTFLGQIIEPRLTIRDDGTQTFTCRVPKFYIDPKTNSKVTNPRWMDTNNGILAENIRVLKVFIQLGETPEDIKVFPMIINKITDRRDNHFSVYKSIEASGLAFAELGKQGYKLELNAFTIEDENNKAAEKAAENEEEFVFIEPTIQYWLDKVFPHDKESGKWLTPWCYEIRMDYSYYAEARNSDQIYEDAYVNNWSLPEEDDELQELQPGGIQNSQIKARYIECANSNKYNITQDIAQAFGVFCRYEYKTDLRGKFVREWTDENGKTWTGKKVIFYNKAIKSENPYVIDYQKNLQTIERTSDGSNIYSKLYVKPIEASNMTNGYVTIADVEANPSYDEFLLNFNYLKSIGAVTSHQMGFIKNYELQTRIKNQKLANLAPVIELGQAEIAEQEAKLASTDAQIENANSNIARYEVLKDGVEKDVIRKWSNSARIGVTRHYNGDNLLGYYLNLSPYESTDAETIKGYLDEPTETSTPDFNMAEAENIEELEELPTSSLNLTKGNYRLYRNKETGSLERVYLYIDEEIFKKKFDGKTDTEEDNRPWAYYLTFTYHPQDRYERIIKNYKNLQKKLQDDKPKIEQSLSAIKAKYETYYTQQENLLKEKEVLNQKLETLLGPALREGYWNPSEYKGILIGYTADYNTKNSQVKFFFDEDKKVGEDEIFYYKEGTNPEKKYFSYIKLDDYEELKEIDVTNLSLTFGNTKDAHDPITLYYGPQAGFEMAFLSIKDTQGNTQTFRALVINFQDFYGTAYDSNDVSYSLINENNTKTDKIDITLTEATADTKQVWPRIRINRKNVQYNANTLSIKKVVANDSFVELRKFYDYYYHISGGYPCFTLKLSANNLMNEEDFLQKYQISYEVSTANEMLYLDARQVAKDNSIPRYSYSLTLAHLPHDFKHIDLGQLVYINDHSLGVHAATGYINEVIYHLDKPQEDEVNVQNYKTKFEDLFNTIVAQSEAMKNGQPAISNVVNNFEADGTLKAPLMQSILENNQFYFNYSSTGVQITPTDGIILTNSKPYSNGVYGQVVLKGGGIFLSSEMDDYGNRIWSTGITPEGINASLITAGQINTELIKIYSGKDMAFAWDKEGIFAYCEGKNGGYDSTRYVRFSREGLQAVQNEINRVSLTWEGLTMKNDSGQKTFYLDNDGNIQMSGTLKSFNYRPGKVAGTGWCIDQEGDAEFNNVKVRGTISASVFEYDETIAAGGEVWVAPTIIIPQATTKDCKTYNDAGKLIFEVSNVFVKDGYSLAGRTWTSKDTFFFNGTFVWNNKVYEIKKLQMGFTSDSIPKTGSKKPELTKLVSAQNFGDYAPSIFYDKDGILVENEANGEQKLDNLWQAFSDGEVEVRGGGDWHLIFHGENGESQGILITAQEDTAPFIDVYDDANVKVRHDVAMVAIPPAVRLGKLNGLNNYDFIKTQFGEIPDNTYGLYSDNVYLTGTIFANAGNFGGLLIDKNGLTSTKDLTIATGKKFEVNAANAIFNVSGGGSFKVITENEKGEGIIVDEDGLTVTGAIYATGGKIGGLTIEDVTASAGALSLVIESSGGLAYSDGVNTSTTLTAKVLKGGATITSWPNSISYHALYLQKASAGTDKFTNVNGPGDDFSLSIGNIGMDIKYKYRAMLEYKVQGDDNSKYVYSDVLSFAMAKKGDPGKYITSVSEQYKATSDNFKPSTTASGWVDTIASTTYDATNKYLWAKITETFSDGTTGEPYVTLRSTWGDKGDAGNNAVSYEIKASALNITRTLAGSYSPTYITLAADKIEGSTRAALDVARYISGGTYGNELRITLYYLSKVGATTESTESVGGSHAGWNGATGSAKEFNFYVSKLTVGRIYTKMVVELVIGTNEQTVAMITLPFTLSEELKELGQITSESEVVVADGKVTARSIVAGAITAGKLAAGAISTGVISGDNEIYIMTGEGTTYNGAPSFDTKSWTPYSGATALTWTTGDKYAEQLSKGFKQIWENKKYTTGVKIGSDGFFVITNDSGRESTLQLSNGVFVATAKDSQLVLNGEAFGLSNLSKTETGSVFSVSNTGELSAQLIKGKINAAEIKYNDYEIIVGTERPDEKATSENKIVWISIPKDSSTSSPGKEKVYFYTSGDTRTTSMVISTSNADGKYGTQTLSSTSSEKIDSVNKYTVSFPIIVVPSVNTWFNVDETLKVKISKGADQVEGEIKLTDLKAWTTKLVTIPINSTINLTSGDFLKLEVTRTGGLNEKGTLYMDRYSTYTITAES